MTVQDDNGAVRTMAREPVTAGRRARRVRTAPPLAHAPPAAPFADSFAVRLARMMVRILLMVVAPIVLLAGLGAGGLYFRLAQSPLQVDFLAPYVEDSINATLAGYRVRVGGAVVALSPRRGFEIQLENVKLEDEDGDMLGSAPVAAVGLDHARLWSGVVAAARIDLVEPRVFVSYRQEDGLSLLIEEAAPTQERLGGESGNEGGGVTPPAPRPVARGINASARSVDLSQILSGLSAGGAGGAGLRQIGLRDAVVRLDIDGDRSLWQVPDVAVDLEERDGLSVISGHARVASREGPFSVSFRSENRPVGGPQITANVRGVKPTTVALALPRLNVLRMSDVALDADANIDLDANGAVTKGAFAVEVGRGQLFMPGGSAVPLRIEAGLLRFDYDGGQRLLQLRPSTLKWGSSSLTLIGLARGRSPASDGTSTGGAWDYELRATDGRLVTSDLALEPLDVTAWEMSGAFDWAAERLSVARFRIAAGGAEITASGEIEGRGEGTSTRIEGQMGPMPLATLLSLWPEAFSPDGRTWTARHTLQARLTGGGFRLVSGRYFGAEDGPPGQGEAATGMAGNGAAPYRLALNLEATDIGLVLDNQMQPLFLPSARVRLENDALEVTAAEGLQPVDGSGRYTIQLRDGRFTVVGLLDPGVQAETVFGFSTDAAGMQEALRHPSLGAWGVAEPMFKNPKGKVSGEVKLSYPLVEGWRDQLRITGRATLQDGAARDVVGTHDLEGAKLTLDLDNRSIDAKGDVIIAGVPAKLTWQRIFAAEADRQPPLRILAELDATDRNQLGLDTSGAIRGTVPVEVTVRRLDLPQPQVHLRADLTNSELVLQNLIWRKPPGRAAYLDADLVARAGGVDIANLTVAGDDIAIEGSARLDAKNHLASFAFPSFTLNLITRLSVEGRRREDGVWLVDARGQSYDGRPFFRSLFNVGRIGGSQAPAPEPDQTGIDLNAEIDTVIGFSEVRLRKVSMKMSKRGGQLASFQARGTLDGGSPLAVELRFPTREDRQLRADTTDAGQAFRLVGFYPNVTGGRMRLQVDLDGEGAAEQTGTLWVENFEILGDAVVSEVVSAAAENGRKVVRQKIPFDVMTAPFSVGHGQFVLRDASLKGPLLGASLRGTVDFERRVIDLGGTYVPLQALNNMFGAIPVLGQILSGPRGEGIFGVTFAVQGSLERPQALVNPLSLLTPGIVREIMGLGPLDPRVQRRGPSARQPTAGGSRQGLGEGWSTERSP